LFPKTWNTASNILPLGNSYLINFVTSISSAAHFSTPKVPKISLEKQGFRGIAVLIEGKNKIS
jgi:hypothetical protein